MTAIRRILCATDLTPTSEPAWEQALLLGRLFDAEILLVHAIPTGLGVPADGYVSPAVYRQLADAAHARAHDAFERLLATLPDSTVKVVYRIVEGAPAQRIVEAAREEAADLVVAGTHGRVGWRRAILGSVADRLVRLAPCPVITVGARAGAAVAPRPRLTRIAYATDFSPSARAAWPWVVALAAAAGADVDLLHVTPFLPVADRDVPAEALGRMAQALRDAGAAAAEAFLKDSPLPRERVRVVITHGVPADQIVHLAETRGASLIAMGTHGWSGLVRWMLGSVAHHVVQAAPCAVLTVGPSEESEGRSHVD